MARSKLTDDKINLIRKRYLQNISINDIALELGIHRQTVRKYVNTIPELLNLVHSEDTDTQVSYDSILTKREQKFTSKYDKEVCLYEDSVEGWTYHLTKHDSRIRQQGLWWEFICYPDSVPPNWIDKLKATHMEIAISPLHDKDVWAHDSPEIVDALTGEIYEVGSRYKKGDKKKAHWHGIIKSGRKTSWKEMNELLQNMLNCPYIQKCRTLKGAFDYFLHINHPERYQGYLKDDIKRLNNFIVEPTKFEQGMIFDEILTLILERNFTQWSEVVLFYRGQPEYILLLSSRPSIVTELLKDNWRKANPEGRVQKVNVIGFTDKIKRSDY